MKTWNLNPAVMAALRRSFRTYPAYKQVLNEAKEEYFIASKKGKKLRRVRFLCAQCNTKHPRRGIQVDHARPVIPLTGFTGDWNEYVSRLFCPAFNLRVLCVPCHKVKTKEENKVRRTYGKSSRKKALPRARRAHRKLRHL